MATDLLIMSNKTTLVIVVGIMAVAGISFLFWPDKKPTESSYDPAIKPDNFIFGVTNQYFALKPGSTFQYEKKTKEGTEKIEIVVTNDSKIIMGIPTTVVWDRVWLNNQLIEDTRDWYVQDKEGNVWYFGEEVDNYENGKLKDHSGSWETGLDEAKPGIVMKASPRVGDSYRQEYYKDEAEDMAEVVALGEIVTVPYGTFYDCLKTRDWSNIDKNANEYKYYCPVIGFVTMEETISTGERIELTNVISN